jgi:hypothetical protein
MSGDQSVTQLIAATAFGIVECLIRKLNQYRSVLFGLWDHCGAPDRDRDKSLRILAEGGIAPL